VSFGMTMTIIPLQICSMKLSKIHISKPLVVMKRINILTGQDLVSGHLRDRTITVHQHLRIRFIRITRSMSQRVAMRWNTISMNMRIG